MDTLWFWTIVTISILGPLGCVAVWVVQRVVEVVCAGLGPVPPSGGHQILYVKRIEPRPKDAA